MNHQFNTLVFVTSFLFSLLSLASESKSIKPYIVISGPSDLTEVRVNIENYQPTNKSIKKSEINLGNGILITDKKDIYYKYNLAGKYLIKVKTWDSGNNLSVYEEEVDVNSKYKSMDVTNSTVFGSKDIYSNKKYNFSVNDVNVSNKIYKIVLVKSDGKKNFISQLLSKIFKKCDKNINVEINNINIFKDKEIDCETDSIERFVKLEKNNTIQFDLDLLRKHHVISASIVQVNILKDAEAPKILTSIESSTRTNINFFTVNIEDESRTTTYVWNNNQELVLTSTDSSFQVSLNNGLNSFSIQSIDEFGNRSVVKYLSNVNLDLVPASLNAILQSEYIYGSYPQSFNITILSDEDLQYLTINGATATLVAPQTYSYFLTVQSPQTLNLELIAFDLAGNQSVKLYQPIFNIDNIAPTITSSVGNNQTTSSNFTTIAIVDNSETVTEIYDGNNNLLKTSSSKSITLNFLAEGLNKFVVKSRDIYNNESLDLVLNIIYDISGPVISENNAKNYFANQFPFTLNLSFNSNENLSSVKINNVEVPANGLSIQHLLAFNQAETKSINLVVEDIVGNQSVYNYSFEVKFDNQKPVITLGQIPEFTNQNEVALVANIQDQNAVRTKISINDQIIYDTFDKSINLALPLNLEGQNRLKIESTDEAGNVADVVTKTIVKDTVAPVIALSAPQNAQVLDASYFNIVGTSNEKLASIKVNESDLIIAADKLSFTGKYFSNSQGVVSLILTATDLAGNVATKEISVDIQQKLLVPELVFVTPSQNGNRLLIVGNMGSTRPNVAVKATTGFFSFNSAEGTSNNKGEFALELDLFNSAKLEVTDSRTGESTSINLSYQVNTTISGLVLDTNGNPLPGAIVGIEGASGTTTTNSSGAFQFNAGRTGDQNLFVDGSAIPQMGDGVTRKFSKTLIAINIGIGQNNTLPRPIYLQPIVFDGTETNISQNLSAVVESPNAPGSSIEIPANAVVFPNGQSAGVITIASVSSDMATIEPPKSAVPTNILALEPSGTIFKQRVELQLPNDSELPAGTDMIILSMNSKKGIWEVDGYAKVTEDGGSVRTVDGGGISHFSLVYAVPVRPYITPVMNPNLAGINLSEGGMSTSVSLPFYKSLGQKVTPTLSYKSSWANPFALVSNIFDIPTQEVSVEYKTNEQVSEIKRVSYQKCGFRGLEYTCWDRYIDYLVAADIFDNFKSTSSYQPESISSQFFISSIASDRVEFRDDTASSSGSSTLPGVVFASSLSSGIVVDGGIPNKSLITYGVSLKKPNSDDYLESGLYPSMARYQVKLKNLVLTTQTRTVNTYVNGQHQNTQINQENRAETRVLDEVFPSDLITNLIVQNKTKSPFGRGWNLNFAQKILNPQNNQIVIEEANGDVSTYALNNSISTIYDGATLGVSFSQYAKLDEWPKVKSQRTLSNLDNYIVEVSGGVSSPNLVSYGKITEMNGQLGNIGTFNCPVSNYTANFSTSYNNYKVKAKISNVVKLPNGDIYGLNTAEHSVFKLSNQIYSKIAGQMTALEEPVNMNTNQVQSYCQNNLKVLCDPSVIVSTKSCSLVKPPAPGQVGSFVELIESSGYLPVANFRGDNQAGAVQVAFFNPVSLNQPLDIIQDPQGNIVIADTGNNRVRKINLSTNTISTIAGDGSNLDSGENVLATSAKMFHPRGLVYDTQGNLYISTENGYIKKVDQNGIITNFAGRPLGLGGVLANEAPSDSMAFVRPTGLAFDELNNIMYVADTGNNRVVKIDLTTKIASSVAGNNTCNVLAQDENAAALNASVCSPTSIALDDDKNLIVTDSVRNKIRLVRFTNSVGGTIAFSPSAKDNTTLIKNADGTWERTYRDGRIAKYNNLGLQISEKNRIGNEIKYQYNNQNFVERVIDPAGQILSIFYAGDKVSRITDPAGRATNFYFSGDNLTSVIYPDSSVKSYSYDTNGLLIKETSEIGAEVAYEYNQYNRLNKITMPNNRVQLVEDQEVKSASRQTNGSNSTLQTYGLESENYKNSTSSLDGQTTEYVKDMNSFVTKMKDALGNITTIRRDINGRIKKIINPDLSETDFVYNEITGDIISRHDVQNNITEQRSYNVFGQITSITDGNNKTYINEYDIKGQLIKKTAPSADAETVYEYNSFGLLTLKKLKVGSKIYSTVNIYDTKNNLIKTITADNKEIDYEYDLAGNIVVSKVRINSVLQSTSYSYDSANRLIRVLSPQSEITEYNYTLDGRLKTVKDSKNKITEFAYNLNGNLISKTLATGGIYQFEYDNQGNVVKEIDPNGNNKTFEYDVLNRLNKINLPDDQITYAHNFRGDIVSAQNKNSLISYRRDSLNRITEESFVGLNSLSSIPALVANRVYDSNSNLISTQFNNDLQINYFYDDINRMTSINTSNGENVQLTYNSLNYLTRLGRLNSRVDYQYTDDGKISRIENFSAGIKRSQLEYSYDSRNNIIQKRTLNYTQNYVYDLIGQLVSSQSTDGESETFSYDSNYNRVSDSNSNFAYNDNNDFLKEDSRFTYLHDSNGNLIVKNPKNSMHKAYRYDYSSTNQLVKVTILDSPLGAKEKELIYSYDVLGRRIKSQVIDYLNNSKNGFSLYYYNGSNILKEYGFLNNRGVLGLVATYTHSSRADDILAVNITSEGVAQNKAKVAGIYYYNKDHLGSIVEIVNLAGNVVQQYRYSSYGEIRDVQDGSGLDIKNDQNINNQFTFVGREFDKETGLLYHRARYYDSSIGRFLQQDADPGVINDPRTLVNKYIYSGNNPINLKDITGYDFWKDLGRGAVLVLAGVAAFFAAAYVVAYLGVTSVFSAFFVSLFVGAATGAAVGAAGFALLGDDPALGANLGMIAGAIGGLSAWASGYNPNIQQADYGKLLKDQISGSAKKAAGQFGGVVGAYEPTIWSQLPGLVEIINAVGASVAASANYWAPFLTAGSFKYVTDEISRANERGRYDFEAKSSWTWDW